MAGITTTIRIPSTRTHERTNSVANTVVVFIRDARQNGEMSHCKMKLSVLSIAAKIDVTTPPGVRGRFLGGCGLGNHRPQKVHASMIRDVLFQVLACVHKR